MNLRIGSRGSQLALWQANHIAGLLRGQGHSVEIAIIKTTGDRLQEAAFAQVGAMTGSKGIFTKEIEEALAAGRVDLAVHSLKDLPTELPEPFLLAATPPRVDPRDVFVSVSFENLAALPQGARVGTSSQRRRAQLKALRPDIAAQEFRGNVDTRLRKLAEGQVDAILLAAAGLDRLEKTEWVRERLEPGRGLWGSRPARATWRRRRRWRFWTTRPRALPSPPSGPRWRLWAEAARFLSGFTAGRLRRKRRGRFLPLSPRRKAGKRCGFMNSSPRRRRSPRP